MCILDNVLSMLAWLIICPLIKSQVANQQKNFFKLIRFLKFESWIIDKNWFENIYC